MTNTSDLQDYQRTSELQDYEHISLSPTDTLSTHISGLYNKNERTSRFEHAHQRAIQQK